MGLKGAWLNIKNGTAVWRSELWTVGWIQGRKYSGSWVHPSPNIVRMHFTLMHLTNAFIWSHLHCTEGIHFASLCIKHLTLHHALPAQQQPQRHFSPQDSNLLWLICVCEKIIHMQIAIWCVTYIYFNRKQLKYVWSMLYYQSFYLKISHLIQCFTSNVLTISKWELLQKKS